MIEIRQLNTRKQASSPYPKPGPIGGKLIRQVIAFLREQVDTAQGGTFDRSDIRLPIDSHILIAVSGGSDSVALAHLLVHYGRKIAPRSQLKLLHINHGWRGAESDQDEHFVKSLGEKWGIPVIAVRAAPPTNEGQSLEEDARMKRKAIFESEAKKYGALVFTAHQGDDLAETVLWRLFTGAALTHGGGIAARLGFELRPFLIFRKELLKQYLNECGQSYREDSTNQSDRWMRGRMRNHLIPEMEKIFPKAVDHLIDLALKAQRRSSVKDPMQSQELLEPLAGLLFGTEGLKIRRSHWEMILEKEVANRDWSGEIHLPGGWRLYCEAKNIKKTKNKRWVLERL